MLATSLNPDDGYSNKSKIMFWANSIREVQHSVNQGS